MADDRFCGLVSPRIRLEEWIANQIMEACDWEQARRYLIRDRDGAYGEVFIRRLRSMGIRDRPTSPRSSKTPIVIVIKAPIVWRAHSTSLCRLRA
jgi:hypothetical protein